MEHIKIFLLVILSISFLKVTAQPKITISEINYKSDKSMDSEDWLELWNYGTVQEDLSNWVIQGEKFNEIFQVPMGTILPPGGRIVLARDNIKFQQINPDVPFLGPFIFRLSGKGQNVRLYDNTST
ncbi:MAG: lamin tail domain-containing protein, partial [Bacteroidetes bacterium]|nr:lamin tail domain-containing protein [Bacteroidota bacterium]